jgi:predicted PurR-regulated permease PerM
MAEQNIPTNFVRRVFTITGIVALVVVVLWIIKVTFNIFLLLLAGSLIAIYFHGFANLIQRLTKLNRKLSMAISIILSLILVVGFFWFSGNRIQNQITELQETLPSTIENFEQKLNDSPIGQQAIEKINSPGSKEKLEQVFSTFFSSTFGLLGDIYVVLVLGLFFTASPSVYKNGIVKLIPKKSKKEAEKLLERIATTLTKWLKGQLLAMLVVAVLTAIGLSILGMPMAFALALIAGVLNFIPNFGPIIAMIPAVLIGFTIDTTTAILVAALYIVVQVIESSFVTPQIQKKMINMPPAIIIIAQLFMGVLTGGWGLVLATPLVAILIVVVEQLYIEKTSA